MSAAYELRSNEVPAGITAEQVPEELARIREALSRLDGVMDKLARQRAEYVRDLGLIEQLVAAAPRWRERQ